MPVWITESFRQIATFFRWESEDRELLQSVSHKVMGTTIAAYLIWHMVATLGWPQLFSPSLFLITVVMIVTAGLAWVLLEKYYLLAQIIWFLGLWISVVLGYYFYQAPAVLFLMAFFPLMSEVMLGMTSTFVLEAIIVVLAFNLLGDTLRDIFDPRQYR